MARTPARRTRAAPGPQNTSRAAGAPTPASPAATEPGAGAFHKEPGDAGSGLAQAASFYAPNDATESHAADAAARTVAEPSSTAFNDSVRRDHFEDREAFGSADRAVVEHAAAEDVEAEETLAEAIERIRKVRKPLGTFRQKLALPTRSGYHPHWFNDVAGRIDEAAANGWSHVKGTDGKPIARCVGMGRDNGALYAFAMEIPSVFWDEDQAAKAKEAAAPLEALKKTPFRAEPGTATASDRGKFYDPHEETGGGPLTIEKNN